MTTEKKEQTTKNYSIDIEWCEAHNYPWKIVDNKFYWQTNYQCAEVDEDGHIHWHHPNFFDGI